MPIDYALFSFVHAAAGRSAVGDWLIVAAAEYLPIVLVLAGSIAILRHPGHCARWWLIDAFAAAIFARYVIVTALWQIIPRNRPFIAYDIGNLFVVNHPSFPSAHTAFLFAFSTVGHLFNRRLGIVLYAASLVACVGRVAAGVHYPSDIIGGIVVGLAAGVAVPLAAGMVRRACQARELTPA